MDSRAVVMREYGDPSVLSCEDVELAPLQPDEVRGVSGRVLLVPSS